MVEGIKNSAPHDSRVFLDPFLFSFSSYTTLNIRAVAHFAHTSNKTGKKARVRASGWKRVHFSVKAHLETRLTVGHTFLVLGAH